jgi:hypothetical protein
MKHTKTVYLSGFRNVVPADYENWIEQLALQGWNIDHIGQWSSVVMTFRRSEPKKYRYIYDLQAFPKKEYKATYEQFGWEFVGQMASGFIWRKLYTDKRPESFTSLESLEKRSKRVIAAASVSFILFLLAAIIVTVCFAVNFRNLVPGDILQFILGMVLTYVFTGYMGYVMNKINKNKQR